MASRQEIIAEIEEALPQLGVTKAAFFARFELNGATWMRLKKPAYGGNAASHLKLERGLNWVRGEMAKRNGTDG